MQIKWLRKALQNLDNEAESIAKNNPQSAQLVVKRIKKTVSI